jgi:hypothetical protein
MSLVRASGIAWLPDGSVGATYFTTVTELREGEWRDCASIPERYVRRRFQLWCRTLRRTTVIFSRFRRSVRLLPAIGSARRRRVPRRRNPACPTKTSALRRGGRGGPVALTSTLGRRRLSRQGQPSGHRWFLRCPLKGLGRRRGGRPRYRIGRGGGRGTRYGLGRGGGHSAPRSLRVPRMNGLFDLL